MSCIETNLPRPVPDVTADPSEHMENTGPLIGVIFFIIMSVFISVEIVPRESTALKENNLQVHFLDQGKQVFVGIFNCCKAIFN